MPRGGGEVLSQGRVDELFEQNRAAEPESPELDDDVVEPFSGTGSGEANPEGASDAAGEAEANAQRGGGQLG